MKYRHFFGARRVQVLPKQGAALFVQVSATRGHDPLDIALRLDLRVDAILPEPGSASPANVIPEPVPTIYGSSLFGVGRSGFQVGKLRSSFPAMR